MLTVRPSGERGVTNIGWLDSRHSFSFGEYYDPKNVGFKTLRVINEDWVGAANGFGKHPHRDMEIVTYIVSGSLEHGDSMGNRSVMTAGEVQRMTAGSGVFHSEVNPSPNETCHLLQIWIHPERNGLDPSYEQKQFDRPEGLTLLVSPDARDGSLTIHQKVELWRGVVSAGQELKIPFATGESGWTQLIKGELIAEGKKLIPGDALVAENEKEIGLAATADTEFLFFKFLA